jgi:hypothetical protein
LSNYVFRRVFLTFFLCRAKFSPFNRSFSTFFFGFSSFEVFLVEIRAGFSAILSLFLNSPNFIQVFAKSNSKVFSNDEIKDKAVSELFPYNSFSKITLV